MAKGRKTKPQNLKLLQGTSRADRVNKNAPKQDEDSLLPPHWLPEDCYTYFDVVKNRVSVYALDSASWTEAAALIAMRITEINECTEIIKEEGRTYISETIINGDGDEIINKKMIKGHPAVGQRNEAMRHLQSLLSEFGLTPASISKVSSINNKDSEDNPWNQFG